MAVSEKCEHGQCKTGEGAGWLAAWEVLLRTLILI